MCDQTYAPLEVLRSSQSVVSQTATYLGKNHANTLQDFQTHLVLIFQTSGKRRAMGDFVLS